MSIKNCVFAAFTGLLFLNIAACPWGHAISTPEERRQFAAEMNAIIDEVTKPLTLKEIDENFYSAGGPLSTAQYILFGENHIDYDTKLTQARALQALVKPGDIVLFEGGNSGDKYDCNQYVFLSLFTAKKWNGKDEQYDGYRLNHIAQSMIHLLNETRDLNLNQLSLNHATCYLWDDLKAVSLKPELLSLTARNQAMVETMRKLKGAPNSRIFVIAGSLHLPSGDLDLFKTGWAQLLEHPSITNPTSQLPTLTSLEQLHALDLRTYYSELEKVVANGAEWREQIEQTGQGSTKVIYDFLSHTNYIELIPRSLLKMPLNGSSLPLQ